MRTQRFIQRRAGLNAARVTIEKMNLVYWLRGPSQHSCMAFRMPQDLVGCCWPRLLLAMIYLPP